MLIKCGEEWKNFERIICKLSPILEVQCDNCVIKCTPDHVFKGITKPEMMAGDLQSGDILYNEEFGKSHVLFVDYFGIGRVYTPLNVDGEYYQTTNGLINHNCSFLGSSQTLINAETLEKLREKEPIRYEHNYDIKIFEDPIPGVMYVMGCDVGSGCQGDYSTIQVIKILSRNKMEEVACYRNNEVGPEAFAVQIKYLSDKYNGAWYIIENQDSGKKVCEELWYNLENYKLISTDGPGKPLGTKATKRSKLDACLELKRLMDNDFLEVHDSDTIKELSRFEEQDVGNVFKAAKGNHDDTVSALYWAVYATMQPEIDLDTCRPSDDRPIEEYPVDYMVMHNQSNDFWGDF